ncbi:SGNH/GDSL hydrolase family protein [Puia sp.]|jgi:lysophospholipase L1-like esterase|uniref:SGNH/GDSL hydrolase family protein n=1 Tax=Puia sp. TaxID=2045100 RepID=UPI002F3E8BEB
MKNRFCILVILAGLSFCASFTHRPITWVAIGDSITYLNDHPNETGNRLTKGYLTDVVEKLDYVHYLNIGRNGWTTQNFARSIDKIEIPAGDVYTIFLGTNDWWHGHRIGTWADYQNATGDSTVYGCMRVLIDKIRSRSKTAPVILMTPMPRADFVYINNPTNNAYGSYKEKDGQTLEQVAEAIGDIGRHEGFVTVDLYHVRKLAVPHLVHFKRLKDAAAAGAYRNFSYPSYIGVPFNPAADEYPYPAEAIDMTFDGLHPSNAGCEVIAEKLIKALKKVR